MGQKNGILISLEGIDGVGKTTQANLLAARLTDAGYAVSPVMSEPPRTTFGRTVKQLLCEVRMTELSELMLVASARSDNYHQRTKHYLADNEIVIMDRFFHSTLVYQPNHTSEAFAAHVMGCGRFPDHVFVLDLPVAHASARIEHPDAIEDVPLKVLEERRQKFLGLGKLPEVELIDVFNLTKEEISDKLYERTIFFLEIQGFTPQD